MNKIVRKVGGAIARYIRYLTTAPAIALLLLIAMACFRPGSLGGAGQFCLALLFLVALPISAYPLQPLIPGFRHRGREGQRDLAIVMANAGYILGLVACWVFKAPRPLAVIYLTYFFTGLLIVLFNKVLHIRASGHGAGVVGPVAVGLWFLGPWAALGLLLVAAVYWASLRMKRHTWPELLCGSLLPCVSLALSLLLTWLI